MEIFAKRKRAAVILAMLTVFIMGATMIPEEVNAAAKPARVKSLKVTGKSYNSLNLSWKKVTGAKGYQIYQSTKKSGSYKKIKTTKATVYTKTGLQTGQKYYYKVRAYKGKSYGKYSAVKSGTPKLAAAAGLQQDGKRITWKKVSGAKGYQVYRAASKTGAYSKVKTTGILSFTDPGAQPGKTYYYKVRAYQTYKSGKSTKYTYGAFSSAASFKILKDTPEPTPPGALPQHPQVRIGEAKVILSWDAVSDAEGYQVYKWMYTDENRWPENYQEIARLDGKDNTSIVDQDIASNHIVRYRVRAYKTYIKNGKTQYVYGPWSSKVGNNISDEHMVKHELIPPGEIDKEIDLEQVLKDIEEVERTGQEINRGKTYLLDKDGLETLRSSYYIEAEDSVVMGTLGWVKESGGNFVPARGPWYGANYVLMLDNPEITAYYTLDGSIPSPTNGTKVTKADGRIKMRAPVHVKYNSKEEEITVKTHFYKDGKLVGMLYEHETEVYCVHGDSYGNGISVEHVKNHGYTINEWVEAHKEINKKDWYEFLPENEALITLKKQYPDSWWERLPEDVTTLYQ